MAIDDMLRAGAGATALARPATEWSRIAYRHPDETFPMWAQIEVADGEAAVFTSSGNVVGVLGPGRYALEPTHLPFVAALDRGGVIVASLVFVTMRAVGIGVAGQATIVDSETGMQAEVAFRFDLDVMVVDPPRFVYDVGQDDGAARDFVAHRARQALIEVLSSAHSLRAAVGDLAWLCGTVTATLARADLAGAGLAVSIARMDAHLGVEDRARIDALESHAQALHDGGASTLSVGAHVQADWGAGQYYGGHVVALHDGHAKIAFDGGGEPQWVRGEQLHVDVPARAPAPPPQAWLPAGARVLTQWNDGHSYPATVCGFRDGHYELAFDGGVTTAWVPADHVRLS